jgi:hypothetical protein
MNFELYLEFELWGEEREYDEYDEFFNMEVTLENNCRYALSVWTYKALESIRNRDIESSENLHGLFEFPPDLFVERANREVCEQVIQHLLDTHSLNPAWIVPDIEEPDEDEDEELRQVIEHAEWPTQSRVHAVTWRAMWRLNKREKVERFARQLSRRLNSPLHIVQCTRYHKDKGLWDVRLSSHPIENSPLQAYGALIQMISGPSGFGGWTNFGVHFYDNGHWDTELLMKRPETVKALEWLSVHMSTNVPSRAT